MAGTEGDVVKVAGGEKGPAPKMFSAWPERERGGRGRQGGGRGRKQGVSHSAAASGLEKKAGRGGEGRGERATGARA